MLLMCSTPEHLMAFKHNGIKWSSIANYDSQISELVQHQVHMQLDIDVLGSVPRYANSVTKERPP